MAAFATQAAGSSGRVLDVGRCLLARGAGVYLSIEVPFEDGKGADICAVVHVTPKRARKIAKALLDLADQIKADKRNGR